jgi:hypothetical protein
MSGQYYFKLIDPSNDPSVPFYFIITPKGFWDKNKCLYDDHMLQLDSVIVPLGFACLMESTYEYDGEDAQSGRQQLFSLGLIENNGL